MYFIYTFYMLYIFSMIINNLETTIVLQAGIHADVISKHSLNKRR